MQVLMHNEVTKTIALKVQYDCARVVAGLVPDTLMMGFVMGFVMLDGW